MADNKKAIELIETWLANDSGYDEEAWPVVEKAIMDNPVEITNDYYITSRGVIPLRGKQIAFPVNTKAIELLRSWREDGDEQEQRETFAELRHLCDE